MVNEVCQLTKNAGVLHWNIIHFAIVALIGLLLACARDTM